MLLISMRFINYFYYSFAGEQTNRGSLIEEINATTFVQKSFSSANKVDPAALMTVPPPKPRPAKINEKPENLFHPNVRYCLLKLKCMINTIIPFYHGTMIKFHFHSMIYRRVLGPKEFNKDVLPPIDD